MNPRPIELIQGHSPNSGRCHHGAQGVGSRISSKFHPDDMKLTAIVGVLWAVLLTGCDQGSVADSPSVGSLRQASASTLKTAIATAANLATERDQSGDARQSPKGVKADARTITVTPAQRQFLTLETVGSAAGKDWLSLPGRVAFRPQANSAVGATVAGRVVAQLVREGETVKAGMPVLTIESADASSTRIALDQATSRLAVAESLHRRIVETVEKGVGLEFERQESEARIKDARAELERARQAVAVIGSGKGSLVTVKAPTNGIVTAIHVAVGATVAPGGEPLLELGDASKLQVVAQIAESDLRRVGRGQEAEIQFPALNVKAGARLENVSPRIDSDSYRAPAYLALAKPVDGLQAGMLAQVRLRVSSENFISVPVGAVLIKDGQRRIVYVERAEGVFEAREVQTGRNRDGRVVILQGLSGGEKVIIAGALLFDTQAELLQ
jgi:cobalt-zinc-cadmium efflux system membrane fusion protein